MNSLIKVQEWLQTILISRGDLSQKINIAQQKTSLKADDMIRSDNGAIIHDRLDIYASGYVLRLLECMRAEYLSYLYI
jgi:hypothetical protein